MFRFLASKRSLLNSVKNMKVQNKKQPLSAEIQVKPASNNIMREIIRSQSEAELADSNTTNQEDGELNEGDFSNFSISKKTIKKLKDNGVENLFSVQHTTYNAVYEGADIIVQARTGTGKTLAFCLPILEKLRRQEDEICVGQQRSPVVLTLAPTRELAIQIHKEFEKFKSRKMNLSCFYGGSSYDKQENDLWNGIDVLVGTPGRILDHIQKKSLNVSKLKHVVLDEADRMMDMGFQESLDEILSHAYTTDNKPQTLLFSATIPPWVKETSKKYMGNDVKIFDLIGRETNKGSVNVEHKAINCSYWERAATIKDVIQVYSGKYGKTIIFTSTKQEANELALSSVINMDSQVLHGDIQQKQRELTLQSFRDGKCNCLFATDVAARGLDIPEIDLVIQTEPPKDVESYIHRAGRTGRAGRNGICIIFYKNGQEYGVQAVEKKAGITFTRIGAPQQVDIIKSSAIDAVRSLDQVKGDVLDHFLPSAKELIEERGAENALAAALAFISGTTEIVNRSMLTSQQGYTTYMMKQNWELRGSGLIWSILRRHFDQEFMDSIRGMRVCKDKLGCVFDVPESGVKVIEGTWKGDKFATLEQITELPELLEGVTSNQNGYTANQNNRNGFGNRNNFNNRNNNFNNRNNLFNNDNRGFSTKGFNDNRKRNYSNNSGFSFNSSAKKQRSR